MTTERAILKVIRSTNGRFRLGLYLPKAKEKLVENVDGVEIQGINTSIIKLSKISWYNKYGTIEDHAISNWIINNGWSRKPYTPIQLIKFELEIKRNKHVFKYVGPSIFKKESNRNRFTTDDGKTYVKVPQNVNRIDFLWY